MAKGEGGKELDQDEQRADGPNACIEDRGGFRM